MKLSHSISSVVTAISLLLSVVWLTPAFALMPSFASLGQIRADALRVPGAMDLDEAGNLYVADPRSHLVHKFSPYGQLLKSFDLQTSGRGLAVTPDGQRLYVSRAQSVIIVDALSGQQVGVLAGGSADLPEFGNVGAIDLDAAGRVYVVDGSVMQIKVYDATGQFQAQFGGMGLNAGEFKQISAMAVSPAGKVVVADSSATNAKLHVFTLDAELNQVGVIAYLNSSFGLPVMHVARGLAFDTQGRGYLPEYLSNQVRVVNEAFAYQGAYSNPGHAIGQLSSVTSVAFDKVNKRLFVGSDSGRIEIFGIDGGQNPVAIINRAPGLPTTLSPAAGSEVDTATPVLMIGNAADEDGDPLTYHVVVRQDDAVVFEAEVAGQPGETTSVVVTTPLAENAAFTWTVRANDGQLASEISAAANFVVNAVEEPPFAPELATPQSGESIDGRDDLVWNASSDPDPNDNMITYLVEVALDETFSQVVATSQWLAETALTLEDFATYADFVDEGVYFWRVFAADQDQTRSEASVTGQFVYDTTALTITANMPDARVSFYGNHAYAGQSFGSAPLELRDLAAGVFSLVVERPGFETFVTRVVLAEQENSALYVQLMPAKSVAKLSVSVNGINGRSGLAVNGAAMPFMVDYDSDGDLDLLVGSGSGQMTLFANLQMDSRNRLFLDQGISLGLPVMPGAVPFVADWDSDGRKDLLVGLGDGSLKLFINTGTEDAPVFAFGVDMQMVNGVIYVGNNAAPAVADYDGDGRKDLLVGNAAGQVLLFMNQGSETVPELAAPRVVLQVAGAAVPLPVDWDADGQRELLLTSAGKTSVYALVDGQYQPVQEFSDRASTYVAAFPITLDESGKQLFVGQADGQVVLLSGTNTEPVVSFHLAMQDKVDQLDTLVAETGLDLLDDLTELRSLVVARDYAAAAVAADELAGRLASGAAQTSALELAAFCRTKYLS